MWQNILNFFGNPLFVIISGIETLLAIIVFAYTLYLILRGVVPVWYRLGIGLSKRSIAVFAEPSEFTKLESMLLSSGIFRKKNIIPVTKDSLAVAKDHTVFLIHWNEFKDKLGDIVAMKDDSTAMVVYAPTNEGRIEDKEMGFINSQRNSIVVNFRGRLLNDILVSMITTAYAKK